MNDFLQLLRETEQELGRELSENETTFLQWVFARQLEQACHRPADEKVELIMHI